MSVLDIKKQKSAANWEIAGKQMALKLFKFSANSVPAYKKFIKKRGIIPNRIKNIADFEKLPIIDKESYVKKNRITNLLPKSGLNKLTTFSATSGSTGKPTYFPRGEAQDRQYAQILEGVAKNQFMLGDKPTLAILGFGLGVWIGGLFTYKALNELTQKGYSISTIPTGPDKNLFLDAIKKYGKYYEHVVLMGYPPFIKDVIDEGKEFGINWKNYNLKILTAAEWFSEEFREYISKKAYIKNQYTDIVNIYGTVELGTMAHETPITTLIRKQLINDPGLLEKIIGNVSRVPTLAQYYPGLTFFEETNGELIASGYGSGFPLIRYRLHDKGGVIAFEEMLKKLKDNNIDIMKLAKNRGINQMLQKLPFVYVYDREDLVATLVGINIYPEYIRNALQKEPCASFISGKCTMATKTDRNHNQFLEINVELKKRVKPNIKLKKSIQDSTIRELMAKSTEYNYLYIQGGKYKKILRPKVILWPNGDSRYFKPGSKQKWILTKKK